MSSQPVISDRAWFQTVATAADLFAASFSPVCCAVQWVRPLHGDFAEVARLAAELDRAADRVPLDEPRLAALRSRASPVGQAALAQMVDDLQLLRAHGHEPAVELLRRYARDADPDLPTDVHSFHVDTANAPTATFLCTYSGAATELLAPAAGRRRCDDPTLRARLRCRFGDGDDAAFAAWLREHAFDLHFMPKPGEAPLACGVGELWRLAVQQPGSAVPGCIHRAPLPQLDAEPRLLLIS